MDKTENELWETIGRIRNNHNRIKEIESLIGRLKKMSAAKPFWAEEDIPLQLTLGGSQVSILLPDGVVDAMLAPVIEELTRRKDAVQETLKEEARKAMKLFFQFTESSLEEYRVDEDKVEEDIAILHEGKKKRTPYVVGDIQFPQFAYRKLNEKEVIYAALRRPIPVLQELPWSISDEELRGISKLAREQMRVNFADYEQRFIEGWEDRK